jgi:hypothetical protein
LVIEAALATGGRVLGMTSALPKERASLLA